MENKLKMEDLIETAPTSEATTVEDTQVETTEQDPLKIELERVKSGRTEEEKAEFTFKKQAERLQALGKDPASILGIKPETKEEVDEDDKPVTLGMLKKMQQESATKSALELANDIPNETERELAKWHLENTIRSTGNPSKDLELALNQVNAVKNKQILEELSRKGTTKTFSTATSAPANQNNDAVELTQEEKTLMSFGNLTVEEVLKARKQ